MNSYQTANAAFHLAGASRDAGVKHGRGFFRNTRAFEKIITYQLRYGSSVIGALARDLQLDYSEGKPARIEQVKRDDGWYSPMESDFAPYATVPTLHGRRKGGIASASAGGTSWLKRFFVVSRTKDGETVYFVQNRTGGRTSIFTRDRAKAERWAAIQQDQEGGDSMDANKLGSAWDVIS